MLPKIKHYRLNGAFNKLGSNRKLSAFEQNSYLKCYILINNIFIKYLECDQFHPAQSPTRLSGNKMLYGIDGIIHNI